MKFCPSPRRSGFFLQKNPQKPQGIALVLTLVVLLLVTIFMTEFFFETTLEIRAIENFKSSFVAQSAVKSMFKAVLKALTTLKEEDLYGFFLEDLYKFVPCKNVEPAPREEGESAPDEEVEFSVLHPCNNSYPLPVALPDFQGVTAELYIRPIDHLFNLNRIQSKTSARPDDSPADRIVFNEFINLVQQIPIKNPPPTNSLDSPENPNLALNDIAHIYAAIFDWMDRGDESTPYANGFGVEGIENYVDFEVDTELTPKNRRLDRLSELKLIARVMESGIPYEDWKQHFTIHDVGSGDNLDGKEPRLNVNLANKTEIEKFLKRFNQNTEYYSSLGISPPENQKQLQEFADNAEKIAEALVTYDENGKRTRFDTMKDIRIALPADLKTDNVKPFFITHNQWYEIRLVAEVSGIQSEINAIVKLSQNNDDGTLNKEKIEIVDFLIR